MSFHDILIGLPSCQCSGLLTFRSVVEVHHSQTACGAD